MWFSWKLINGLNFWEEDKAGISEGRTVARNVRVQTRADYSARIVLDLEYGPPNAPPFLREERALVVSVPNPQDGYSIDWTMSFTAQGQDVVLDRTPIPGELNGKSWGGYAGLSARLPPELSEIQVSTTEGEIKFTDGGYRGRAMAADYSGKIGDWVVGIAFLDHPDNLASPSPWWIIDNPKGMKYINPAVLGAGPHTLKSGQRMTLRYRAIVHPERWDAKRLRDESERYIKGLK